MLEVPEAVATAHKVEDVAVMQDPVEDGDGQNLVAGENLHVAGAAPYLDRFTEQDERDRVGAPFEGDRAVRGDASGDANVERLGRWHREPGGQITTSPPTHTLGSDAQSAWARAPDGITPPGGAQSRTSP